MNNNIDYKEVFELTRRYGKLKNKSFDEQNNKKCLKGALFAVMLAIKHISKSTSATTSLISEELEMTKPQVSRLLNSLENDALICRTISKADHREIYIQLTEKGIEILKEAENNYISFIDYLYESMGAEDFNALVRLLKKVESAMEARYD